ncbi:hypothetical protein LX73_0925 [Fodinibius salinus]|uniref:Phosphoglycolate phosphatase n=1 Tax=Fodinibius salinus TaxID=860790 RepID=A0A5D3YNU6_9BACT|nr:HAD family hydrolase [Fodinibius salinus]TYP95610.1 hypothetical protein LX73_0925 [Fodinibius salinus]
MIKLFITDIDGCLSIPFETPDWELLSQIRRLNQQSIHDMAVPPLTICSGRPLSYVEAVVQWLGIDRPTVFESAGIYTLEDNNIQFLPSFDEKAAQQVAEIKHWMKEKIMPLDDGLVPEFTKKMDAGIIHLEKNVIDDIYPTIKKYVEAEYPRFEVHQTEVSINVILKNNTKKNGIMALCDQMDIAPSEAAYIGDSSGDISGLKIVGRAFAPNNAAEEVKEHAEVLEESVTRALLKAYRTVIQDNRKMLADAE